MRSMDTLDLSVVRCALLAALPLLVATPPSAAQPTPLGPEVGLDTEPGFYSRAPILAGRRDGTFGLAWARYPSTSSDPTFVGAVGNRGGLVSAPVDFGTGDFRTRVTDFVTVPGGYRALWEAPAASGGVALMSTDLGLDGAPRGVARRLARANETQWVPRPRGGYVTWWAGEHGLSVQLVGEDGTAASQVVRLPIPEVIIAWVLHERDSSFVLVYEQIGGPDPEVVYQGLKAQRFDAAGRALGKSFRLLPPPGGDRVPYYRVALGVDGTLAVVSSIADSPADSPHSVTLRAFTTRGVPLGPSVALTSAADDASEMSYPHAVAVDPNGRVLVVWAKVASRYSPSARARLFTRTGVPLGPAFELPTSASGPHVAIVSASVDWAGDAWLISWIGSTDPIGDEGTTMQVYVRRFARE
jgi:hypothetical protein